MSRRRTGTSYVSVLATLVALVLLLAVPRTGQAEDVPDEDAIAIRVAALGSDDVNEDLAARMSLVKMGVEAVPQLVAKLGDDKAGWPARSSSAWVLGEIGSAKAKAPLRQAWTDSASAPGFFVVQVAMALGSLGDHQPLLDFLKTETNKVLVAKAAMALANFREKKAVGRLKELLDDPDIGDFIAIALGRLGEPSVAPRLKPLLTNGTFRDYAAVALGALGDRSSIFQVRFALDNPDPFVRRDAVEILARWRDTQSFNKIEEMAGGDPDERVREASTKALKVLERRRRK